ncbi:unnamed protein product [Schistosoma curassoni]|uniref:DUF6451 domain-containing protein n=1 Tax=Schistosoma curassoni TaxID=6186 RepID=A0A183JM03_9TREM|nr:unnamed protein product [Schistosoma curassoni]
MQLDYSDFAYDLTLLPHTHQRMQVKTNGIAAGSTSVGLNMHKGKYKILKYNTENTNTITLDGETMEEMESFRYLCSIIDEKGGFNEDVKARIGKATASFLQLKNSWNSKQLSINVKVTIFNTNVRTDSSTV